MDNDSYLFLFIFMKGQNHIHTPKEAILEFQYFIFAPIWKNGFGTHMH